ncbi:MAG: TonB-dependent receptor [Idiomarina sp.]
MLRSYVSLMVLASLSASSSAFAQVEEETTNNRKNEYIETIEVLGKQLGYHERNASTALRQNIPLLETPQSIFVINDALIKDQQSFRIDQILQNDSSVQKANNFLGAYSSFQIRGFQLNNATNYLRNGRPFFNLASPPVETLNRVEVLKGPSSVLYGTMAPGGIVNMAAKRASFTETTGFIKATVGSDNLRHIHLDTAGALNDDGTVRYRLNLVKEDSENYREFFNGDAFEVERQIGALALEWDLSDDTRITFDFDDTNDDRPQDSGLIASPQGLLDTPKQIIFTQPWSHYNSDVRNYTLVGEHYFNSQWSIKAGFSYQDYERDRYDQQYRGLDFDTGDLEVRTRRRINRWDFANAFVDVSGEVNAFGFKHQLLVGTEQTQVETDNNETERNEFYTTNIFDPVFVPNPNLDTRAQKNLADEKRKAVFAQDLIHLADQWRLLVGFRYDDVDYEFYTEGGPVTFAQAATNLTPRVGLLYLPNPNSSVYATYSESFEPNGAVGSGYDNEGEKLDPTMGEMTEIGYKWESLDGDFLFTTAAFQIERTGSPMENELGNLIVQRGTQRHKGAEAAATGLVGNWSLTASVMYLDAEFIEDQNPALIGNTPVSVPELTANLWAEYQFTDIPFSLQAGWSYESDRPVDNANSFDLDSYHKVDIGAKYEQPLNADNGLVYRLTISNLFDETYYKSSGLSDINWESPRQIRASIEYRF